MAATVAIAASSSGANELVAAVAGRRIRVIAYKLSFSGSVNAKFQSGSTDLTGLIYGVAAKDSDSVNLPQPVAGPLPQFATAPGEALNLNLSAGTAVGGYVVYDLFN